MLETRNTFGFDCARAPASRCVVLEDEEGTHGAMFPGAAIFPEDLAVGFATASFSALAIRTPDAAMSFNIRPRISSKVARALV